MGSKEVVSETVKIERLCKAIVMFGPATSTSGFRPAEYFMVTIDPDSVSPSKEYIRFGRYPDDEINGWQRVEALTVCEILGYYKDGTYPESTLPRNEVVEMRVVSA